MELSEICSLRGNRKYPFTVRSFQLLPFKIPDILNKNKEDSVVLICSDQTVLILHVCPPSRI